MRSLGEDLADLRRLEPDCLWDDFDPEALELPWDPPGTDPDFLEEPAFAADAVSAAAPSFGAADTLDSLAAEV